MISDLCKFVTALRLEIFFALFLHLGNRVVGWGKPGLGLALLVHHKLGEVPFDGIHQKSALLRLK